MPTNLAAIGTGSGWWPDVQAGMGNWAVVTYQGQKCWHGTGKSADPAGNWAVDIGPLSVNLNAGDRIIFFCWIATGPATIAGDTLEAGGRIGIDFYGKNGRIGGTSNQKGLFWDKNPSPNGTYPYDDTYVPFGVPILKLMVMDFIVPSTIEEDLWSSGYGAAGTLVPGPYTIIPWLMIFSDIYGGTEGGQAWFGNPVLYILHPNDAEIGKSTSYFTGGSSGGSGGGAALLTLAQGKGTASLASGSFTVNLNSAPAVGNTLMLGFYGAAAVVTPHVTGITQPGVVWTYAGGGGQSSVDVEIWRGVVGPGASEVVTVAVAGGTGGGYAEIVDVSEFTGVLIVDPAVDQTATNAAHGVTGDSGITAITTKPLELVVAAIGGQGSGAFSTADIIGDALGATESSKNGVVDIYPITASSSGILASIGVNCAVATGNIRLALYSTRVGNVVSGLLGQSASVPAVLGWNNLAFIGSVAVIAGATYYIAIQADSATYAEYYNYTGVSVARCFAGWTYGVFPEPTPTLTPNSGVAANLRLTYGGTSGSGSFTTVDVAGGAAGSTENSKNGYIDVFPIFASASGILTSIGINCASPAAGNIRLCLYSTCISDVLSGLLGQSASTPAVSGWNDLAIPGGIAVTAGTTYYIGVQTDSADFTEYFDYTGASVARYNTGFIYDVFPDPTITCVRETGVEPNIHITYGGSSAGGGTVNQSNPTDADFTLLDGITNVLGGLSNSLSLLFKKVSETGTQNVGVTFASPASWSGVIVTFFTPVISSEAWVVVTQQPLANTGTVAGVGIQISPSSLDWGVIVPGSSQTLTVQIVNRIAVPQTLHMLISTWGLTHADNLLTCTWDQENTVLDVGATVTATLTLTAAASTLTNVPFDFSISILGVQ